MPRFPALRRQRGYYGRRPAARSGGYKRFSRRTGPRSVPVRGRVHALRIMSNPVPSYTHNIVAPRFFTNLEYGYAGLLAGNTGYQFSIKGNSTQTPGNTSQAFTASSGTLFPATHALTALQPVGVTALAALYNQYRVWESTITISMIPLSQSIGSGFASTGGCQLVVVPTSTEEGVTDVQLAQSLPYAKAIICNGNGSQKDNTIIKRMDTRTMYGISDAQMMADPNYYAANGSDPSNLWWWSIVAANFSNLNVDIQVQVRLNFRVELFDPKGSEADT